MRAIAIVAVVIVNDLCGCPAASCAEQATQPAAKNVYARWSRGPAKGPDFFPIAIWLQAPRNAPKHQALDENSIEATRIAEALPPPKSTMHG